MQKSANLLKICAFVFVLFFLSVTQNAEAEKNKLSTETEKILSQATAITLFSLESKIVTDTNYPALDGYKILGQKKLEGAEAKQVIGIFQKAILKKKRKFTILCFNPRHAIQILHEGKENNFLLCYECGKLWVFHDGKTTEQIDAGGSPQEINAILVANKIPLAIP